METETISTGYGQVLAGLLGKRYDERISTRNYLWAYMLHVVKQDNQDETWESDEELAHKFLDLPEGLVKRREQLLPLVHDFLGITYII